MYKASLENEQRFIDFLLFQTEQIKSKSDYFSILDMVMDVLKVSFCEITFISKNKKWCFAYKGDYINTYDFMDSIYCECVKNPAEPIVIEDISKDKRFDTLSLIQQESNVSFYVGVPLVLKNKNVFGWLSVFDTKARVFSENEMKRVEFFANQVVAKLELDYKEKQLDQIMMHFENASQTLEIVQKTNCIGFWSTDIISGNTFWSDILFTILELPNTSENAKNDFFSFCLPEYTHLLTTCFDEAIKRSVSFDQVFQFKTGKHKLKWIRISGQRRNDKLIGSFEEITELVTKNLQFKGMFNSTKIFIGFLNLEGILLELNDTAINSVGLSRKELVGKYFWDTYWWQISHDTQQRLKESFLQAVNGKEVTYEERIWIKDKKPVTILFTLRPLKDELGKVSFIIPEGRIIDEFVAVKNRLAAVIAASNMGIWEWNIETNKTFINENWAAIIGYTLEELVPVSVEKFDHLIHEDDICLVKQKMELCMQNNASDYEVEIRMKHKLGHWVWVLSKGRVSEYSATGEPLVFSGTHQDITKKKNRVLEIERQKHLLDITQKNNNIGSWELDFKTGKTEWSEMVYIIHEVPLDYNHNKEKGISFYHPDYQQVMNDAIDKAVNEHIPYDEVCKLITAKKNIKWVRTIGKRVGDKLIGSFQDVTKEKFLERRLQNTLSQLEAIFHASNQVAIFATDLKGEITLFNSGAEKMLGYSAVEVIGKCSPQKFHLAKEVIAEKKRILETYNSDVSDDEVFIFEANLGKSITKQMTFVRCDESEFPVLLSVSPIRENNQTVGILGVATDITELKKAESELKGVLALTSEQNKRLKNFSNIVSHNLRSHSAGISGLVEILEEDLEANNELVSLLKLSSKNLMQTVEDLTEVVKVNLSNNGINSLNLNEVISKNLQSLSFQIKQSTIQIHNLVNKSITIKGVPAYVDSIILNFITNAIKYRNPETASFLRIYADQDADFVILCFEDNGLGIDLEKHKESLFGMYQTFHTNEDSRGVGLFLAKNQIESMGGKIEVYSTPLKGTTFKIYFRK